MVKNIKILNYAVNGLGLGHITRLISINKWLRRISGALGINTEIIFITTSESDSIAYENGFASFKIPSKNIIKESGISFFRYRRLAKQWIWNAINLVSPDILIVDTFPSGSFDELYNVFDFGFKKIFIYRNVRKEIAEKQYFQNTLFAYDKIITVREAYQNDFIIPPELNSRTFSTGEIISRDIDEIHSRSHARKLLGIGENEIVCYVSAGGGGDPNIRQTLDFFINIANEFKNIIFVFGLGPLFRGNEFHADNIRLIKRYNIIEYFYAFDFAISAGGYNTVFELLYCSIPSIFYPQDRNCDDQFQRINKLSENNFCLLGDITDRDGFIVKIRYMIENSNRNIIRETLLTEFKKNSALDTAKNILSDYISEDDIEHILPFIPGSFFYSLNELNIPESTGLKTICALDYNFHTYNKQKNALAYVNDFFGIDSEIRQSLEHYVQQLYTDFIEYPLNHLAISYLKFIQNKNINMETGIKFLSLFVKNNFSADKSIQDILLLAIRQIDAWCNLKRNIDDSLEEYIFNNKDESGNNNSISQ